MNRRYVPSLLAAIGEMIERHMIDIGFLASAIPSLVPDAQYRRRRARPFLSALRRCQFHQLEGCDSCLSCG